MTRSAPGTVRLVQVVAEAWALTDEELASLLGRRNAERQKYIRFAEREERVRLIYLIHSTLSDLFIDADQERRWIRAPLALLNGETPLNMMLAGGVPGMFTVREIVERYLANRR